MNSRRTRYTARWVLPVTAHAIENGAVLVGEDGTIEAVGADASVPLPDCTDTVALGEAALLPALINVHAHPELTGFRGLLDDLPFSSWIPALNAIKRATQPTAEEWGYAASWACLESLRNGIATVGATEDSGAALDALNAAGMRGVVYREVFGPAPEQAESSFHELELKIDQMRSRETEFVRVGVSPHASYTVSDDLFRRTAQLAISQNLPIAVHAAEAQVEDDLVKRGEGFFAEGLRKRGIATSARGKSTIELLDRLGVLRAKPLLIHCVRVSESDIKRIADSGSAVAHCPIANARLGHGIAPVLEMLHAHVRVAIGTDSVASNNRLDMLDEAHIAQTLQRARAQRAEVLPSARLLELITIDAARVLGFESRIGSLEVGKDADLCAVSLQGAHAQPVHDVLASLFHAARGSDVILVTVKGRVLARDGKVLTLDENVLQCGLDQFALKLREARASAV